MPRLRRLAGEHKLFTGALAAKIVWEHPRLELVAATSRSDVGKRLDAIYPRYRVPIVLTEQQVDHLFSETYAFNGFQLIIDLEAQVVRTTDGGTSYPFEVAGFRKYCLLNGFDDIGLTLRHADKIRQFEAERLAKQPWLNHRIVG